MSIDRSNTAQSSRSDATEQAASEATSGYNPLPVLGDNIPDELKTNCRWAVWNAEPRNGNPGKFNKAPRNAARCKISVNKPEQWMTFEETLTAYQAGKFSGIGVLLDGKVVGLDIDEAKEAFKKHPTLKEMIKRAIDDGHYCEKSPSSTGLRLFVKGDLMRHLGDSQKGGTKQGNLEIYQEVRFLTVTGHGQGEIKEAQSLIDEYVAQIEASKGSTKPSGDPANNVVPIRSQEQATAALSAEALEQKADVIAEKVAETRAQLWGGDWNPKPGPFSAGVVKTYASQSDADYALACEVARQARAAGIPEQQLEEVTEVVCRRSGLVRDKWDEPRGTTTYLGRSVRSAVRETVASASQSMSSQDAEGCDRRDVKRAELYAGYYCNTLKFNATRKHWLQWSESVWELRYGVEIEAAKDMASRILSIAEQRLASDPESDKTKKLKKFALDCHTAKALETTPKLASTDPRMHIVQPDLDPDQDLLCVQNGYVNLRTGEMFPPEPQKLMSRQTGVAYDPEADCPQWIDFLNGVFEGDQSIIRFLQCAIGYSLTGRVDEERLFILYGFGANGKSVFQNTLMRVFGSYARTSPPSLLVWKAQDDGPKSELAALTGVRLTSVNELESGDRLHEQTVKRLAGREPISARFLYSEFFEYWPTAKVWLRTNHQPIITGTDDGIWRRLVLVPFKRQFIGSQKDPDLEDKLISELSGILTWAIQGAERWFAEGLLLPPVLVQELQSYRTDSDVLGEFLSHHTVSDPTGAVPHAELWSRWKQQTQDDGFATGTKNSFTRRLKERGFDSKKISGVRCYTGLRLERSTGGGST